MEDKKAIFNGLMDICEKISNSKLIMFNAGLSNLLTYIARNKSLMDFIKDCNIAVDYRKEYYEATNLMNATVAFKMPADNRKIIALVTGILFDIDRGEIELYKFLKSYFDMGDINACYDRFVEQIIFPYCEAFIDYVNEVPLKLNVSNEPRQEQKNSFEVISEQVLPFIESVYSTIYGDSKLSDEQRADYLVILEGFCYALEQENSALIRYLWIGLKYTLKDYQLAMNYIGGIKIVLTNYGIID